MASMCDTLIELLKTHAVKYGKFTLSSGKESLYYLDVRQVTLRSEGAEVIARMIEGEIGSDVDAVGGMAIGADPIVGALLMYASDLGEDLLGFIVRKEPKDHGLGRLVEGPLGFGMTVIIVEDVATTGASALAAADAVIKMDCRVKLIVAVVDRLEGAAEACAARGIPFKSLVTIRDLGITA